MLTTTSVFIKTLVDAGITHAFCNWGSDHPAMLEELARLGPAAALQIITCPHESIALSAAQGFFQATGRIAAVLVHVDVGTQSLAGAVHNCARGRAPVLIYAGAAPFTDDGELRGSRNEFIFWLQDAIDQPAIVRQYMRHTAQIQSGKNVARVIYRALQLAQSEPKGPVYLWARREVMEEEVDEDAYARTTDPKRWPAIEASPIPESVAANIVEALAAATAPLIISSNIGRNPAAPLLLAQLCDVLCVPVVASCPTAPVLPPDHPAFAGVTYGRPPPSPTQPNPLDLVAKADVILIVDADVPFAGGRVPEHARIFHIDVDPLKEGVGTFHAGAEIVCRADGARALAQLLVHARQLPQSDAARDARRVALEEWHARRTHALESLEVQAAVQDVPVVPGIMRALKRAIPNPTRTLVLNEAVSNYPVVWEHLWDSGARVITSGGSSLGWGLGASIGARLATFNDPTVELVVLVVGDGSFLFGVPAAAYWIAQNYQAPFLTVVLNNGGWRSPKLSMLGVHPSGHGAAAENTTLGVAFATNYSGIAGAAGNAWGRRVTRHTELEDAMQQAVNVVISDKRCAVVDCVLEGF